MAIQPQDYTFSIVLLSENGVEYEERVVHTLAIESAWAEVKRIYRLEDAVCIKGGHYDDDVAIYNRADGVRVDLLYLYKENDGDELIRAAEYARAKHRRNAGDGGLKWIYDDGGHAKTPARIRNSSVLCGSVAGEPRTDCVIRSTAIVTGRPYAEVWTRLMERRIEVQKTDSRAGAEPGVNRLEFIPVINNWGQKTWPFVFAPFASVGQFVDHLQKYDLKVDLLVDCVDETGHLTAIKAGKLRDVFDCRHYAICALYGDRRFMQAVCNTLPRGFVKWINSKTHRELSNDGMVNLTFNKKGEVKPFMDWYRDDYPKDR